MAVEDEIEKGTVHVEPVVVGGNEVQFAERIHDETDAGARITVLLLPGNLLEID